MVEAEKDRELRSLKQKYNQQIQDLEQIIQSQTNHLVEKDHIISQKGEAIVELRQHLQQSEKEKILIIEESERKRSDHEISRLERQLTHVNQQLEESKRVSAQFQGRIAQLEQLTTSSSSKEQRASIKLTWREGEEAPCTMSKLYCAAVDGKTLYVRLTGTCKVFSYTISTSSWSRLPDSLTSSCPSVIINNLLTLVGGYYRAGCNLTNQLFSLTGEGNDRKWSEEFPNMPTKRQGSLALCTGTALVVAGWIKDESKLKAVELLNTETLQWSTAADLPQPLCQAPAAVCGDCIYVVGESTMYTCSVITLIQHRKSFRSSLRNRGARVWKEVASPPVTDTTCVSIHGQLLAIGGKNSDRKPTSAIHMYNPTTDSWEVISHMETPRYYCIAAVLLNNQLMVVGGYTGTSLLADINSIEFATVE